MYHYELFDLNQFLSLKDILIKFGYIPIYEPLKGSSQKFFVLKGVGRKLNATDLDIVNFFKGKIWTFDSFREVKSKLSNYAYVINYLSNGKFNITISYKKLSLSSKEIIDIIGEAKLAYKYNRQIELEKLAKLFSR